MTVEGAYDADEEGAGEGGRINTTVLVLLSRYRRRYDIVKRRRGGLQAGKYR